MSDNEELFAQSMKTTLLSNPPSCTGNWARAQSLDIKEVTDWGP